MIRLHEVPKTDGCIVSASDDWGLSRRLALWMPLSNFRATEFLWTRIWWLQEFTRFVCLKSNHFWIEVLSGLRNLTHPYLKQGSGYPINYIWVLFWVHMILLKRICVKSIRWVSFVVKETVLFIGKSVTLMRVIKSPYFTLHSVTIYVKITTVWWDSTRIWLQISQYAWPILSFDSHCKI